MGGAIYTHPSNLGKLGTIQMDNGEKFPFDTMLGGLPVYIDKNIPPTKPTGKVKFPDWKFCEFEEKDEEWALGLGFATREEEPVYYMVDNSKFQVNWDIANLKLDWSIDAETEEVYKAYTQDIQERVIQGILDRLSNEIINSVAR